MLAKRLVMFRQDCGNMDHICVAVPDLPIRLFDHIVGADTPAVLVQKFRRSTGPLSPGALTQAAGGRPELPRFLRMRLLNLG